MIGGIGNAELKGLGKYWVRDETNIESTIK